MNECWHICYGIETHSQYRGAANTPPRFRSRVDRDDPLSHRPRRPRRRTHGVLRCGQELGTPPLRRASFNLLADLAPTDVGGSPPGGDSEPTNVRSRSVGWPRAREARGDSSSCTATYSAARTPRRPPRSCVSCLRIENHGPGCAIGAKRMLRSPSSARARAQGRMGNRRGGDGAGDELSECVWDREKSAAQPRSWQMETLQFFCGARVA